MGRCASQPSPVAACSQWAPSLHWSPPKKPCAKPTQFPAPSSFPPLNRSSKNAKNFPRHSSLYSYPSWLPAALKAGKNITEETTYGVTTKTCQVKIRATLCYRSKKAQEMRFLPLTFGPIFMSSSQTLRPASDQWVHWEVQCPAPRENKYFKKPLVQCQGFTVCPRAVSGKQRLCCTPVKPSAGHTLQPPPHSRWTWIAVRKPSSFEGRNSLGKLLNCFPVSKVLVPKGARIPAAHLVPYPGNQPDAGHSQSQPGAGTCTLHVFPLCTSLLPPTLWAHSWTEGIAFSFTSAPAVLPPSKKHNKPQNAK